MKDKKSSFPRKNPIWLTVLLLAFAVVITFQATYISAYKNFRKQYFSEDSAGSGSPDFGKTLEKLEDIKEIYDEMYYGEMDPDEIETYTIAGFVYGTGDKYGEYMDPETYKEFTSSIDGDNQGIGITVIYDQDQGALEVVSVSRNSPAEKADVIPGDMIAYVGIGDDRESVAELGYSESVMKLQGKAGTKAEFIAYRNGEEIEFSITRDYYEIETVEYHMYSDGKTGVVRILQFNKKTPDEFFDAIDDLLENGAERFVFDLRDNPGGELDAITTILDFLVPEGPIIHIVDNQDQEEVIYSDKREFDHPMTVLTNENTASAAELFTAALKDYNKAISVGMNTYGKGSIQTILPLEDGSGLRITYGHYDPPYSGNYDGVGIAPDIGIDLTEEQKTVSLYKIKDEDDGQLIAAVEYLNTGKIPDSADADAQAEPVSADEAA